MLLSGDTTQLTIHQMLKPSTGANHLVMLNLAWDMIDRYTKHP
jgi:hypothetical protein